MLHRERHSFDSSAALLLLIPVIRVASRGMLGIFPNIVMFVLNVRFIINDLTHFDASFLISFAP